MKECIMCGCIMDDKHDGDICECWFIWEKSETDRQTDNKGNLEGAI